MGDAHSVRGVERAGDLGAGSHRLCERKRPTAERHARQPRGERLALQVLHDQEVDFDSSLARRSVFDAKAADVIERADVTMVQV